MQSHLTVDFKIVIFSFCSDNTNKKSTTSFCIRNSFNIHFLQIVFIYRSLILMLLKWEKSVWGNASMEDFHKVILEIKKVGNQDILLVAINQSYNISLDIWMDFYANKFYKWLDRSILFAVCDYNSYSCTFLCRN